MRARVCMANTMRMNDAMTPIDPAERPAAEPKPKREPVAVCTLFDDGTFRAEIKLPDLYLVLQHAQRALFHQTLMRAVATDQTLRSLRNDYRFPAEIEQGIDAVLSPA